MKYIITLLMVGGYCMAGLDETKKWYESKLEALRKQYIHRLEQDKERAARFNKARELIAIDKELSSIMKDLDPMAGSYRIKYSTGIRIYEFKEGKILFNDQNEIIPYVRNKDVLIINHSSGAVETWERSGDGWKVLFITPDKQEIKGYAKKGN